MMYPDDVKYTKTHEWVRQEGFLIATGITSFAAEQLSDIVYVELPAEESSVTEGEPYATVESVKAVSDCYSAVTGTVKEVNRRLENEPELLNNDPYGDGWMIKIEPAGQASLDSFMDAAAYGEYAKAEEQTE
jgi:glycine cleavage system H protein